MKSRPSASAATWPAQYTIRPALGDFDGLREIELVLPAPRIDRSAFHERLLSVDSRRHPSSSGPTAIPGKRGTCELRSPHWLFPLVTHRRQRPIGHGQTGIALQRLPVLEEEVPVRCSSAGSLNGHAPSPIFRPRPRTHRCGSSRTCGLCRHRRRHTAWRQAVRRPLAQGHPMVFGNSTHSKASAYTLRYQSAEQDAQSAHSGTRARPSLPRRPTSPPMCPAPV
jgi:hypothetical protein